MSYPLRNLCINWDFDIESKSCYFNPVQTGAGSDVCISLYSSNSPFFEFCSISPTNVYLSEASFSCSLELEKANLPFVFMRNLGPENLVLNFSHTGQTGCFIFDSGKINENYNSSYCKYLLKKNESIFLNLHVYADGSLYYSEACYPFGFYYKFSGLKDLTTPDFVKKSYLNTCNLNVSTFSYDYFETQSCYLDTSNNHFFIKNTGDGFLMSSSAYCNKPSYKFEGEEQDAPKCGRFLVVNDTGCAISFQRTYLCAPASTCFSVGSQDHTIEFFANIKCLVIDPDINPFFGIGKDSNNPCQIWMGIGSCCNPDSGVLLAYDGVYLTGSCVPLNTWHHFALTRSGNLRSLWMNGSLINSGCSSITPLACPIFTIGTLDATIRNRAFNGCISNFRIVTGQSLYNGTGYSVPFGNLNENGTEYQLTNITGCVTFLAFNQNETGIPSDFSSPNGPLFGTGNPFFGNRKIRTISYWELETGSYEQFSLTGKCFTIEAVVNQYCKDGSIISNGNSLEDWSVSGAHFNLYFKDDYLNFDWRNTGCLANTGKNFISVNLSGNANWSGGCNWNYIAISANQSAINLWLNGVSQCCLNLTSDDFDTVCQPAKTKIGSSPWSGGYLFGAISNLRFIKDCYILDPSCSTIINPIACSGYKDYWFETGNSSLLINLDPLYVTGDQKIKSFSFNKEVNNGVGLCISLSGENTKINTILTGISTYGGNCFCSELTVNYACVLSTNKNPIILSGSNFYSDILDAAINSNCCINILYNICYNKRKIFNYCYIRSGDAFDSDQTIVNNDNFQNLIFDNSCFLCANTGYFFNSNSSENLKLNLNLKDFYSIKDLIFKDYDRCNLFLPPISEFNYAYCFNLGNVNKNYEKSITGTWDIHGTGFDFSGFKNCSTIISTSESEYQNNKSELYSIKQNVSESRYSTKNIQNKSSDFSSEYYDAISSDEEISYFYSGLEFRYYPIKCVFYKNQMYRIPDSCVPLTFCLSGNCINLNYPLQALSTEKLKIIADYETIERVNLSEIRLIYSDIEFNIKCECSNYSDFIFPKITNENLSGKESPSVCINTNSCVQIQSNLNFYLTPFEGIKNDKCFGLNNLMFFIASELNSGLVYCCNYTGFCYQDSNYNFFMIDLQNEFYECCFIAPSGSGSFLIDQRISFLDLNTCFPIPYKTSGSSLYNYIVPIQTGFYFYDSGIICECQSGYFSPVTLNGFFKDTFCQIMYSGGSSGVCDLFDLSGVCTGSFTGFKSDSTVSISEFNYNLFIPNSTINETSGERFLNFQKLYTYSGVQPIKVDSNYPLADIKFPLMKTNLQPYNSNNLTGSQSEIYYYVYNINNFKECQLKFLAPDLTDIEYICFSDENSDENLISFSDSESPYGFLQKNAASVKFSLKNLICSNLFSYSDVKIKNICINIIGGL